MPFKAATGFHSRQLSRENLTSEMLNYEVRFEDNCDSSNDK